MTSSKTESIIQANINIYSGRRMVTPNNIGRLLCVFFIIRGGMMSMLSDAKQLFNKLNVQYHSDKEWIQANVIIECMKLRDIETVNHSLVVAYAAHLISKELTKNLKIADRYFLGGLLHDVGKINMQDSVLKSNETLSKEEIRSVLELHVNEGVKFLKALKFGDDVIQFCMFHHERLNGSGYPSNVQDSEIPLIGRIAAVSDVFGAMSLPRLYRPYTIEKSSIVKSLMQETGSYDQEIVQLLNKVFILENIKVTS
ncbi:HD-GYP domain-containing protein [Paenibacillus sp. IITD108]|uniref:HD-GYP domain-containing protein n=1 Tax=Paenibacillus sp. IITD108 TaxID=3116649 RepID=UPI002F414A58